MSNKEGRDFYHSLSRKELQSLCKRYGLPARKSSFEMAESLFSYSQEFLGGSVHYTHGASQSQFVSQCAKSGVIRNLPCSGRIEHAPLCQHRHVNEADFFVENISDIRSYTKVPASFEFHASSEEGIKLCVDLSSSPLDWTKKYKNQVSFCKNVDNAKSKCLPEELGRIGENNEQIKKSSPHAGDFAEKVIDGLLEDKPSSSLEMEEDNVGSDHQEGINSSLMLLPSKTCSEVLVEDPDCLREDLGPNSSKLSSDVHDQIISNKQLCNKNGSSATLVSDITDIPIENTACNFVFDSISDGSVDLVATENHNSTYDDEIHENSILRKNGNHENNCVVPRFLTSSEEMQLSETGNYHKGDSYLAYKNGDLLGQDDSNHNLVAEQAALTTSSGNGHTESHLAEFAEDQEWSNISFGRESSVCSQVENSVGKTCLKSSHLELNEEFPKKRPAIDNGVQNGYSKPGTKFIRSMKHSSGEVFPRRSTRLVSK